MKRTGRQRGFSIVELMVAVTIAIITGVVVLQVLATYEARRRTVTVGNDAEMSAAVGLYMVERDVRMAGAGFTAPTGLLCGNGINMAFNNAAISDGDAIPFVRVVDGGAGPDRVDVMRSDAEFGVAPGAINSDMSSASDVVSVADTVAIRSGDLFVAASPDGVKRCTLMQATSLPTKVGSSWIIEHDANGAYNPDDPAGIYTNPVLYDAGDAVFNLGRFGMRSFLVACNDGGVPSTTNSCVLGAGDALALPDPPAIADLEALASPVIDFQVQYGVAPAGSQDVNEWVDATGAWADPSPADQRRIKAIRLAVVTRGNLEREMVSPDTLVLWDRGGPNERTVALTDDQRYYRYKVLNVVVPVINMIWAGV